MRRKLIVCAAAVLATFCVFACAAMTKKGSQCKRPPSPGSQYCWQHGGTTKAQREAGLDGGSVVSNNESLASDGRCHATIKSGEPCKRTTKPGEKFCWQHASGAAIDAAATPLPPAVEAPQHQVPTPNPPASNGLCTAITKKGSRCTRKAQPGSSKCWQHGQE